MCTALCFAESECFCWWLFADNMRNNLCRFLWGISGLGNTAWSPQEAWSPWASQELFCQLSGQNREVTRSPSLQQSLVLIWSVSCSNVEQLDHTKRIPMYTPSLLLQDDLALCVYDSVTWWFYDTMILHSLLGGIWMWIIQGVGQIDCRKSRRLAFDTFLWCYRSHGRCSIVIGIYFLAFI